MKMALASKDLEAVRLYRLSADQGNSDGISFLADMYIHGKGVEQDQIKVSISFGRCKQGRKSSMTTIGWYYLEGTGVPKDYAKALNWTKRAIREDEASTMVNLGHMYENWLGVPADFKKAELYQNAIDSNNENDWAYYKLGTLHYRGFGVAPDLQKAIRLFKKAASLDNVRACRKLAEIYRLGIGVTVDLAESIKWLEKANSIPGKEYVNYSGSWGYGDKVAARAMLKNVRLASSKQKNKKVRATKNEIRRYRFRSVSRSGYRE